MGDPQLVMLMAVVAAAAAVVQAQRALARAAGPGSAATLAGGLAKRTAQLARRRPALQDAVYGLVAGACGLMLGGTVVAVVGAGTALALRRLAAQRRRRARVAATERSMPGGRTRPR